MLLNGLYIQQWHVEKEQTIVMLHGFTGATKTWQKVAELLPEYRIVAIDAVGHGQSDAPSDVAAYEMQAQLAALEAVFTELKLDAFVLIGYSMGGRIALSYTVRYPQRVQQLVLESASPGLKSRKERMVRKMADDALANKIEQNGLVSFVDAWENIPLFTTQKALPKIVQEEVRAERLAQRAHGLANSLRGMGTGIMPSLWDELANIQCPVILVTGALDLKFVDIAHSMQKQLKNAQHYMIPAVGHAIHVENPVKFATIVKETISLTI